MGEYTNINQQLDDKEIKQFWCQIWERREHKRKAKWISNIEKELGFGKRPKVEIQLDLLGATLKKVPNCEMPGHDAKHEYWF